MRQLLALILLVLVSPSVAYPQSANQDDDVIRVDSDVTNLPFTATDKQRRFITTLRAEDVRVLEDGVPQQVLHVSA